MQLEVRIRSGRHRCAGLPLRESVCVIHSLINALRHAYPSRADVHEKITNVLESLAVARKNGFHQHRRGSSRAAASTFHVLFVGVIFVYDHKEYMNGCIMALIFGKREWERRALFFF